MHAHLKVMIVVAKIWHVACRCLNPMLRGSYAIEATGRLLLILKNTSTTYLSSYDWVSTFLWCLTGGLAALF